MSSSVGKRLREQQKLEKAKIKAERRAARHAPAAGQPPDTSPSRGESELIEDLGALHRAFEAGEVSPEDFQQRRDVLQAQFEQLL